MRFPIGLFVLISLCFCTVLVFAEIDRPEEIRRLAIQGKASAQFALGIMHYSGKGVTQDYTEALKWFRKAADQGLPEAQFNLGLLYSKGLGVDKDSSEAFKWFHKAAQQDYQPAQFNLGVMYAEGEGVAKDNIIAYAWLVLAMANGNESAKKNLLYLNKLMTASEIQQAVEKSESFRETIRKNKDRKNKDKN